MRLHRRPIEKERIRPRRIRDDKGDLLRPKSSDHRPCQLDCLSVFITFSRKGDKGYSLSLFFAPLRLRGISFLFVVVVLRITAAEGKGRPNSPGRPGQTGPLLESKEPRPNRNHNTNPGQQPLFNKDLRLNPKPNQPSSTQELALQSPPRMI